MTDRVLIPLPGIGTLAMSREVFAAALVDGSKAIETQSVHFHLAAATPAGEPLISAAELAAALSLPKTWIEQRTRRGELPCIRAGRWIRYNRRAVEAALSTKPKER